MKRFLNILFLHIALFSCSSKSEEIKTDFVITQLKEFNNALIKNLKANVIERGNLPEDLATLKVSESIVTYCREAINTLADHNKTAPIQKLFEQLKNIQELDIVNSFEETFNSSNNSEKTSIELKRSVMILELKLLSYSNSLIGKSDLSFDKLELVFIPDYSKAKVKLKGRLVLAAKSDEVGKLGDYFFNGEKLEKVNGEGIVDCDLDQIKNRDLVNFELKLPKTTFIGSLALDKSR